MAVESEAPGEHRHRKAQDDDAPASIAQEASSVFIAIVGKLAASGGWSMTAAELAENRKALPFDLAWLKLFR
jgi:hypothetical protein